MKIKVTLQTEEIYATRDLELGPGLDESNIKTFWEQSGIFNMD